MSTYTFSYTDTGKQKLTPVKPGFEVTKAPGDTEQEARRYIIQHMFNSFRVSLSDEDLKLESTVP